MQIKQVSLAIFAALITQNLFAASFDCLKATTLVEHIICDRAEISELDVKLGQLYSSAQIADSSIRDGQRLWLRQRNECTDEICVLTAYKQRIYDLEEVLAGLPAVPPTSTPHQPQSPQASTSAGAASEANPLTEPRVEQTEPPALVAPQGPLAQGELPDDRHEQKDESQKKWWEEHFIALTISTILGLGIPAIGLSQRCPECNRWFAAKLLRRKLLNERTDFKTITRRDQHKDTKGNLIKTVEREEQIRVQISTYRNYYRCKYCQNEWTTVSTSESS